MAFWGNGYLNLSSAQNCDVIYHHSIVQIGCHGPHFTVDKNGNLKKLNHSNICYYFSELSHNTHLDKQIIRILNKECQYSAYLVVYVVTRSDKLIEERSV